MRGRLLLRVDWPLVVRGVWLRGGDILEHWRDVVHVVCGRPVLGCDGVHVPFVPEWTVPNGDRGNVLRLVRFGLLQCRFGTNNNMYGNVRGRPLF